MYINSTLLRAFMRKNTLWENKLLIIRLREKIVNMKLIDSYSVVVPVVSHLMDSNN